MEVPIQLHPIIFGTLVLCGVVYLCQFENCLECISLGIFDLIIHFAFGVGQEDQQVKNYPVNPAITFATQFSISGHH